MRLFELSELEDAMNAIKEDLVIEMSESLTGEPRTNINTTETHEFI